MKFRSRDDLRTKIIDIFSRQDEVYQISVFGTEVDGVVDQYSDIDMFVCSSDRYETQRKYQSLFESIAPVIGKDFIGADPYCYAEMLMLRDYCPYHKVDFSIAGTLDDKKGFGPFLTVYEDQIKRQNQKSEIVPPVSLPGVVQKLNDILFSIPRFTKCLFRQDGMNLYRRWTSIADATMVLWWEKYTWWQEERNTKKLSPPEVHAFIGELNDQERHLLDVVYPNCATMNVAESFQACVHQFVELSKQKAQHFHMKLDDGFIEYMEQFMDNEIQQWRQGN